MRDTASAPAASTALAMTVISVTFGDNFTMTGFFVCVLTCSVTAAAALGSVPNTMPPSLTLGQEILTSSPATPSTSSASASLPYSSAEPAEILTIRGAPICLVLGRISRLNTSSPGFSRPIQLSMPDGVSATRTPGFPALGSGVIPLEMTAPISLRSRKSLYSTPNPKVPEAPMTGVFMGMPANVTANRFVLIKIPPSPGIPVRLHTPYAACHRFYWQRYSRDRRQYRRPCVFP